MQTVLSRILNLVHQSIFNDDNSYMMSALHRKFKIHKIVFFCKYDTEIY